MVEESMPDAERSKAFGNTYKRRAHVEERKRMHHRMEPLPPGEDLQKIREEYERYRNSTVFRRELADRGIIHKTDIQGILRSLDRKKGLRGWRKKGLTLKKPFTPTSKDMKNSFTKRYLEKWETLRGFLLGEELQVEPKVPVEQQERDSRVGTLFMRMSAKWNEWQNPELKQKRGEYWKYPDRKNFPNFNFFFSRLSKELGVPYSRDEFPEPTTAACRMKLAEYFRELAGEIGLPGFPKLRQLSLKAFISKSTQNTPLSRQPHSQHGEGNYGTLNSTDGNGTTTHPSPVGDVLDLCNQPGSPRGGEEGLEFSDLFCTSEEDSLSPAERESNCAAAYQWLFGEVATPMEGVEFGGGETQGGGVLFPSCAGGFPGIEGDMVQDNTVLC
jgi:hypothetical protein